MLHTSLAADLAGVLQAGSGRARLVLETLLSDPQAAALDPVLLTGRHVACGPECAERLLKWLREAEPGLELTVTAWGDLAEITGPPGWEPRRYVPLVTRFHAEGGSRCLIGTRALLGEGWDAPAVNVVIDLTAATTPTSVVQARGRALRLDAGWPGKVADNWGVVCVTGDHPKGTADFDRFARKHGSLDDLAAATADALHAAKLTSRGGHAVQVEAQAGGGYRARLQEVPEAESALFAEALDEVLGPLSQPRYVIGRLILPPPAGPAAAAGLAVRRLVIGYVPATVVYHAVPTALSGNKKLALAFERAWNARIGPGSVVYAGSPEGTGILAAQRGDDPFALTTQIRTLWRRRSGLQQAKRSPWGAR